MKTAPASVLVFLFGASLALAQGPLTPPGAPAPTMKSLDQIEARTPIPASPAVPVAGPHFTISTPGSYYLTGNVTVSTGDCIRIACDDVTLDLNGFKISSSLSGSFNGAGVSIPGSQSRITVRNGSIVSGSTVTGDGVVTGNGFLRGIYAGSLLSQCLIENIHLLGVQSDGIFLDVQGVVRDCTVRSCGGRGILAQEVMNSSAENCVQDGIVARSVTNCGGNSINSSGITSSGNALNCYGSSKSGNGMSCNGSAENCTGTSTSGTGLTCIGNTINCTGSSNSGAGLISGGNASNCVGTSVSTTAGVLGMLVSGTANSCRGRRDGGVAIQATIAIGCTVNGTGTVSAPQKFLGTP